jgi:copper chaperone NosL
MRIMIGLFSLLILVFSCGDTSEYGPSEIYYGEDICERCKMIISEKEFASQYKISDKKNVKFDDIGCMIHFMDEEKPEHIESIYVMDYDSGEWIDAESGYFVWTETVNTPMGYGILSFNDKKIAQEVAARENGKYLGKLSAASELLLNNSNKSD